MMIFDISQVYSMTQLCDKHLTDDTTLTAESEAELKSLLMKMKEKWKSWLKVQHSEN